MVCSVVCVCAKLVTLSEQWAVTVARSSHSTHQSSVELPQQQPAEGEFRKMSDTQMIESHSIFVRLIFCPRIVAHTLHLN